MNCASAMWMFTAADRRARGWRRLTTASNSLTSTIAALIAFAIAAASAAFPARAQQIVVPRVEAMPNLPQPYEMRDWQRVAVAYDSLVFDLAREGEHLPLVWINESTVNYPDHPSFGLHTVVGTPHPQSAEAINALPALVGATLSGVDKSDFYGRNWVLMAEEWFNRRPEENVYLNHPNATSGSDWWYDTMPNVFFYQAADLYPDADAFGARFDEQLVTVADRWLEAVETMGGSAAPWTIPDMTYRGWVLSTMKPNQQDPAEPEAAGAIAWLLYHAYVETGEMRFRQGAEWAMEYLDGLSSNPSYELQLPYGAYVAARMNAELETSYDVEKLVNWTFDVGPIRQWGVLLGRWGDYDVHGLVGEAGANGYAFAMNTFEQVGALVPLVRYDDRFARAIGKWVLNAANASRLFYTEFLPDSLQDSDAWAHEYDPQSVIAHEALRQFKFGRSPYATGDAVDGGWGATNLALYGSSHVGIFGGIIDTTNVPGILRLDATKTDYFQRGTPATYVLYNPHEAARIVELPLGPGSYDVYDAVSNTYLTQGASGAASIEVLPDDVVLAVLIPQAAAITYDRGRMLAGGLVVDYRSAMPADHPAPRVKGLGLEGDAPGGLPMVSVRPGETRRVHCTAENAVEFVWTATAGTIEGEGAIVEWAAPTEEGDAAITCTVRNSSGDGASETLDVRVASPSAHVIAVTAHPRKVDLGGTTTVTCTAENAETYLWSADAGTLTGSGSQVTWHAPAVDGEYRVVCRVDADASDDMSVEIIVRDFSAGGAGDLVAFYRLDGSAEDASGFDHDGAVAGAVPTPDYEGGEGRAFRFDGVDDAIRIPNSDRLNFRDGITIAFWMRADRHFDREAYPLSHGNWERRWKVSLTDERLRWTVKTDQGVNDLDSETPIATGVWYHAVVRYDGRDIEIYLDGALDAIGGHSGRLLTTDVDLMLGQVLPGNTQYNFAGALDDVRIFDHALSTDDVLALYAAVVDTEAPDALPTSLRIHPPFPNPFGDAATIRFETPAPGRVFIHIYDMLGRRVHTLAESERGAGLHALTWDGRTADGAQAAAGPYLIELFAGGAAVRTMVVRVR